MICEKCIHFKTRCGTKFDIVKFVHTNRHYLHGREFNTVLPRWLKFLASECLNYTEAKHGNTPVPDSSSS